MQVNMGMAGEFRCVVKRADGSTKIDTGYQKNLVLNQGLDFLALNNKSFGSIMDSCVIGTGSTQPVITQTQLENIIAGVSGTDSSKKYDYDQSKDGNLYKTNKVRKYVFNGLANANISEVGLASDFTSTTNYNLCTRALIKDANGNPTTITILSGEVLEIYYKLWTIYELADKTGQLNLLDGTGVSTPYNYTVRLANVAQSFYGSAVGYTGEQRLMRYGASSGDLATFNSAPTANFDSNNYSGKNGIVSSYVKGSFKNVITYNFQIDIANFAIRTLLVSDGKPYSTSWVYQIRFGSVANDSPITKTNTQTLSIPIEISWGRYEGAL